MEKVKQGIQQKIKSLAFMDLGISAFIGAAPPLVGLIAGMNPNNLTLFSPVLILTSLTALQGWSNYRFSKKDEIFPKNKPSSVFLQLSYDKAASNSLHAYINGSEDFDEKMAKLALVNLYLHTHELRQEAVAHSFMRKTQQSLLATYPRKREEINRLCEGHGHGILWIHDNFHDDKIRGLLENIYPDFHGGALLGRSLVKGRSATCWEELFCLQGQQLTRQDLAAIDAFNDALKNPSKDGQKFHSDVYLDKSYEKFIHCIVMNDNNAVQPLKKMIQTFKEIRDSTLHGIHGAGVRDASKVCESCLELIEKILPKVRLEEGLPLHTSSKRAKTKL